MKIEFETTGYSITTNPTSPLIEVELSGGNMFYAKFLTGIDFPGRFLGKEVKVTIEVED